MEFRASNLRPVIWARTRDKILNLCSASGRATANRFGMRRKMAGSISPGLFVAPNTSILSDPDVKPSHELSIRNQ